MILCDKLYDDDYPTFPQFQKMLREYEAELDRPKAVTVARSSAATVSVRLPQRFRTPEPLRPIEVIQAERRSVDEQIDAVKAEISRLRRLQMAGAVCDTEIPRS